MRELFGNPYAKALAFAVLLATLIFAVLGRHHSAASGPFIDNATPGGGQSAIPYTGQRTDFVFVPNISVPGGGTYQYRTRVITYLFLPGGRVYDGLPADGDLAHLDCHARCGMVTGAGDAAAITWPGGATTVLTTPDGGATLRSGKLTLQRIDPAPEGLRLSGTYGYRTYVDTSGAGGRGNVSGEHTIAFSGDGTFTARSFVGSVNSGGAASEQGDVSGTYSIAGYTLQLSYAGGGTVRLSFYVHPESQAAGNADLLVIGGAQFLRLSAQAG